MGCSSMLRLEVPSLTWKYVVPASEFLDQPEYQPHSTTLCAPPPEIGRTTPAMASAVQSLRLSGKNLRCTKLSVRRITPSIYEARTFSTTFPRHVPRQEEEELAGIIDDDEDGDDDESTDEFIRSTSPFLFKPDKRKFKEGFHNLGEEGSGMVLPDEDFGEDDITGVAHGQLDEHREYRHYLRIAAWEMPLLSSTSLHLRLCFPLQLDGLFIHRRHVQTLPSSCGRSTAEISIHIISRRKASGCEKGRGGVLPWRHAADGSASGEAQKTAGTEI